MAKGVNNQAKKDMRRPKTSKFCDHCQKSSHKKVFCSKLVGYLNWYEAIKGKRTIRGAMGELRLAANVAHYSNEQESLLDEDNYITGGLNRSQFDSDFYTGFSLRSHEAYTP